MAKNEIRFRKLGDRTRIQKSFDRKNITITKYGKTYNVFDAIQEANIDTDIYTCIEKYGNLKNMERTTAGLYGDYTKINNLRDLKEKQVKMQELFESMPISERKKFGHDIYDFMTNGEQYLRDKTIEEYNKTHKKPEEKEKSIEEKLVDIFGKEQIETQAKEKK